MFDSREKITVKFGDDENNSYLCRIITSFSMRKPIIMFAFAVLLAAPAVAVPMTWELGVAEQIEEQAKIIVDEESVLVSGAQGETLEIVSITGRLVARIAIDSPSQRVELNLPKGCYILKIGKVVRKVSVR